MISEQALRQYYEASFDGRERERFKGVEFDEYLALMRFRFPGISPWRAAYLASSNGRGDFARLLSDFVPDADVLDAGTEYDRAARSSAGLRFTRKGVNNLSESLVDVRVRALSLVKQAVEQWAALGGRPWLFLECLRCATTESAPADLEIVSQSLQIDSCDQGCLSILLSHASVEELTVIHSEPLDLALLDSCGPLRKLAITSPLALPHASLPRDLDSLRIGVLDRVDGLRDQLAKLPRLRDLRLSTQHPMHPSELPAMPRLAKLSVAAHPRYRNEWIEFGMTHTALGLEFTRAPPRASVVPIEKHAWGWVTKRSSARQVRFEARGVAPEAVRDVSARLREVHGAPRSPIDWEVCERIWIGRVATLEGCRSAGESAGEVLARCGPSVALGSAVAAPISKEAAILADWESVVPQRALICVRRRLNILSLSIERSEDKEMAIKRFVEWLNDFNASHARFVGTIERNDLMDALAAIGETAGLRREQVASLVEQWEDW